MYQSPQGRLGRLVGALLLLLLIPMCGLPFYSYCQMFGFWSSSPRCGGVGEEWYYTTGMASAHAAKRQNGSPLCMKWRKSLLGGGP